MSKLVALDTNVLYQSNSITEIDKAEIALRLINQPHFLSAQVVSEYINILQRLLKSPKTTILPHCIERFRYSRIIPLNKETLTLAEYLVRRYQFQIFDAIIIASALEADCNILYSEDMQHNQRIEGRLRIINPFLSPDLL